MAFTLPPLPYAPEALEPYIDTATMKVHHGGHHNAYVNNLNKALESAPDLANKSVEEIRAYIGADSLAYLSLEGLKKACAEGERKNFENVKLNNFGILNRFP